MSRNACESIDERSALRHKQPNLKLQPYDPFPSIFLTSDSGAHINLHAINNRPRLIVFIRGSFCSFCEETLTQINNAVDTFYREGIDIVAASADTVAESRELSDRLGLRFPLACGLTVEHMEQLGLYVHTRDPTTSPKYAYTLTRRRIMEDEKDNNSPPSRTWRKPFCEPAHFFLRPDNTVKYQDAPDALYHL